MEWLFWGMVTLCAYAYAGYPLALWVVTRHKRQPWPEAAPGESLPSISIMLPAHNEAKVLGRRIENLLGLDYPAGRTEIVVGLDGCTDDSLQVASSFAGAGVLIIDRKERRGKTDLLNEMVARSKGALLVYTDANCAFDRDALRQLVIPFGNPGVGCVIGELKYENEEDPAVGGGEGLYWRLENSIKEMESLSGKTLVANGSIYAMRRELFEELPGWISDDSVNPLRVLAKGFMVVFHRRALAREKAALLLREEFGRKARMVTRQLGAHSYVRFFLWPPRLALAARLISHKLLRWLVPLFLILAFMANLSLVNSLPYSLTMAALAVGMGAGLVGGMGLAMGYRPGRVLRLAAYFWVVNLAALKGLLDFARGRQRAVWKISASTR